MLLVPKHGVLEHRKDADISSELVSGYKLYIPIVSANMPSVTSWKMAKAMYASGGFGILHRFNAIRDNVEEFEYSAWTAGCSLGLKGGIERARLLYYQGARIFCLDVAHGDHEQVIIFISNFKEIFTDCKLIVGNVATFWAANRLAELGVDAIKVGIGPGAACRTREVTGFGVPQFTAIMECARVKKYFPDVKIIADGGIRNSGDIVKALAAGADTVMIGSLLAGCNEAPNPGEYYGNAAHHVNGHRAPEGSYGKIKRTGSVEDVIKELAWGIRSGLSYGGVRTIKELQENPEFVQISAAGQHESSVRVEEANQIEFYMDQIAETIDSFPV